MIGKHHAIVAGASWLTVLAAAHRAGIPIEGPHAVLSTAAAVSAGLAPDIDEPGATISRNFGFLGKLAAKAVRKAAKGHRGLTHTLGAVAIAAGVTVLAALTPVTLGVLLVLLVALALDVTPKVSEFVEWTIALCVGWASAQLTLGMSPFLLPVAVAWGWHMHLICDRCTMMPIPYAWPLRDESVRTSWKWFKAGSTAETWTVAGIVSVCLFGALRLGY